MSSAVVRSRVGLWTVNAPGSALDERALFHLLNLARQTGGDEQLRAVAEEIAAQTGAPPEGLWLPEQGVPGYRGRG